MPRVSTETMENLLFPLPPLDEQKRIVEKLGELLPLVSLYGEKERAVSEMDANFAGALKKSVLAAAVSGKLLPQDAADEPAAALLARIEAEKAALIKAKKLKKEKNPTRIVRGRNGGFYEIPVSGQPGSGKREEERGAIDISDQIPFDIPESWEWVRLGTIFRHNTGKALNSSNRLGQLLEYITTSNLYWDRFEIDNLRSMYFKDSEIDKCTAKKGDLLVCEGGDIGRAAIWPYDNDIRIQNHIHRLRAYVPVCTEFFYYLFFFYKGAGLIGGKGIGIQGLSSDAIHNLLFPLPPLAEQKRIAARVREIFATLDELH